MNIVINIIGLLLVFAVIYWFWVSQPRAKKGRGRILIIVESGVYQPSVIEVSVGQPIILDFLRKDKSPCAQIVQFKDLDIHADLTVGKHYSVALPDLKPGTYEFTCQMGMYRGKLVVK